MANTCKGYDITATSAGPVRSDCDHEAEVGDYCMRHYQQERRGRLGKSKQIAAPGEGDQVVLRVSREVRAAVVQYASKRGNGFTPSDAWREAITDYLDAKGARK